jgi:hypothetical protein
MDVEGLPGFGLNWDLVVSLSAEDECPPDSCQESLHEKSKIGVKKGTILS